MEKQKEIESFLFYGLCIVAFTINYPKHNINSIAIIIFVVISVIYAISQNRALSFFKNKKALIYSSIYLIYVLGLIHSSNLDEGLKNLRLKLPLALFPLVFSNAKFVLSSKQKEIFQKVFIAITIALCSYMILAVFFDIGPKTLRYIETGIKSYYHSELTIKIDNHPTYLSFTLILCILFLKNLYKNKEISSILYLFVYCFFTALIFLLSSKVGVILFLGLSIYMILTLLTRKLKFIFLPVFAIVIIGVFSFPNKMSKRFYDEVEVLHQSFDLKDKAVSYTEKSQRLIAIDIFLNQPIEQFLFGLGSGDIQDYLDKRYRYYLPTRYRTVFTDLNYHNQYLQTASVIGVLGLILLLYMLYCSLKAAIAYNNMVHLLFLICTLCFFAIESFFETHRGTVMFAFFNYMFVFLWEKNKNQY